jgi:capsid portal protein
VCSSDLALINLKRDLLVGMGLSPVDGNVNTQAFIDKINSHGDDLNKVFYKISMDFAIMEMFALQIIYDKVGRIYEVLHQDITKVRAMDEESTESNLVKTWLISNQWAKITNKTFKRYTPNNSAVAIQNFNPNSWSEDAGRQLLVCRKYTPNSEAYSIPSYQSVLQYIQLDRELSNFHLNKVSGGLFANAIVYLTGNPSDEEKTRFVNEFKRKYVGSNKEKLLFVWGDYVAENQLPKVIPFSTNDEKEVFKELNDIITQKIVTAHRATPELAGIQTNNASLGGDANKLNVSRAYYIETVINPMRNEMLDTLNLVFKKNEMSQVKVENAALTLINTNTKPVQNDDTNTR